MNALRKILFTLLYATVIGWTIYLLTVDFYSMATLSQAYDNAVSVPFPVDWGEWQSLGLINGITLIILLFSAILANTQIKNLHMNGQAVKPND
ncbi:MAG: hypothetical protein ACRCVY_08055 [Commensalibacter sp.]|nr:hypothetical protein [Commensalibacter sp.]